MSWHEGPMLMGDAETTGVQPHLDRIVTFALIFGGRGQTQQEEGWLINPGIEIPEGAAAVHGITTERARDEGVDPRKAIPEIADAVIYHTRRGVPFVGFNCSFDLTMLLAETIRYGSPAQVEALRSVRPIIDTFVLDKWADRYRKGSRKLVDVAAHYGVDLSEQDAHGAAADALAAGRIAWHIANKYPGAQGSAFVVHDWLIDEKREQAESFGAYLRKQGKPDDVSREWPIQSPPEGWSPDQLPTPATESTGDAA
ncbi:MAG TPA: exonuclease domain-containing protein [Phytomonospora sp.]